MILIFVSVLSMIEG